VKASIIDPHGYHLDHADVKLKALASFAIKHGDVFHRIEALSAVGGKMKFLDMKRKEVREAVLRSGQSAADLYTSEYAVNLDD
jgi:hypothetical protein